MNKMIYGVLAALLMAGCSPKTELVQVYKGDPGAPGSNGHSLVSQYAEASEAECSNGGSRLDVFMDLDDSLNVSESDLYLSGMVSCNGLNALNGTNGNDGSNGLSAYQIWLNLGNEGTEADFITSLVGATGSMGPAGHDGNDGHDGNNGNNGLSAYQIWLNLGNEGTEADFIASLVGPQGPQGPAGSSSGSSSATITQYGNNTCTLITGTSVYVKNGNNNTSLYSSSSCSNSSKIAEVSQGESYWVGSRDLAVYNSSSSIRVIHYN